MSEFALPATDDAAVPDHHPLLHEARRKTMKVAMITEGTYPFHDGGVAVWCDQLVCGMPHEFELHAITTTGTERPVRELPANVSSLRRIPLWGPTTMRRSGNKLGSAIREELELFFWAITSADANADAEFLRRLEHLFAFAQTGELQTALFTSEAVELTLAVMGSLAPRGRTVLRASAEPTVADAVASVNLLEHLLRPLSVAPPKADICHATSNGLGALLAMGAKWADDTPFLLTEHGLYLRERYIAFGPASMPQAQRTFMHSFFKRLTAAAYQVADVIAPVCEYNRVWEQANGALAEKIRPIYNGIDELSFGAPTGEPDVPTLVWVGRIDPLKDVKTLLRAFSRVRHAMPAAKLRIFGGTPEGNEWYERECVELCSRLGLDDIAVFEGRVSPILAAYHAGHAVLATSISEGFPYAVIEAMASGRAVIATDVGGVREAVGDAGILVPPGNDVAMAEACLAVLRDPERRTGLGLAGRERVLSTFTLDMCLSRYGEVYEMMHIPTAPMIPDHPLPERSRWRIRDRADLAERTR